MLIFILDLAETIQLFIRQLTAIHVDAIINREGIKSMENFTIIGFNNIFTSHNTTGAIIEMKKRYCSCFIIVLQGSIRFTHTNGSIVADSRHPVFLPQGLTYKNYCLEDAESLVFNFYTQDTYSTPISLSPIPPQFAAERYASIERTLTSPLPQGRMEVLAELYGLAARLFASEQSGSSGEITVKTAMEYLHSHYTQPELTMRQVAKACFISEAYLRKLFATHLNTTPFRYLTQIRMTRAQTLALEKLPIAEIAASVGYADIYQFSRAYKKHFGYPPSETAKIPDRI